MRQLRSRMELPALLVELELTGFGAEIGVQYGEHAAHLLEHWPGFLHAIDPWRASTDYQDLANVSQQEQDAIHLYCTRRLSQWWLKERRCQIHRMTGSAASSIFGLRGFDWVYLDARHDYQSVLQDLVEWTPHIKPGGILMGHDYLDGEITFTERVDTSGRSMPIDTPDVTVFGVKRAVDEWAGVMGWTVESTTDDQFPTWLIRVP